MSTVQKPRRTVRSTVEPAPLPVLLRELERTEREHTSRETAKEQPAAKPERTPRPFAYD